MDYNQPMKTVRQRILDYIRSHRAVTVAELSHAFQMTEANARHHLASLAAQGLLQRLDEQPAAGKGRPAHRYAASEQATGNNYALLSVILLDQLTQRDDPSATQNLLGALANRLASSMATNSAEAAGRAGENLTRRLYRATEILNRYHYQARWEARPDAPRLTLGHCPYAALLPEHPELCRMDGLILENLLGAPVEQTARLVKDPLGLRYCLFRVQQVRA